MWVRSRLWYFLSPLDGASVREAHCAQATVARLVTFEVEIFFRDQQRIVYESIIKFKKST